MPPNPALCTPIKVNVGSERYRRCLACRNLRERRQRKRISAYTECTRHQSIWKHANYVFHQSPVEERSLLTSIGAPEKDREPESRWPGRCPRQTSTGVTPTTAGATAPPNTKAPKLSHFNQNFANNPCRSQTTGPRLQLLNNKGIQAAVKLGSGRAGREAMNQRRPQREVLVVSA